jgi:O-antigen/teichoic acid export membrane protein
MNQYSDNSTEPSALVVSSTLIMEDTRNVEHVTRRATRGAAALAVRQVLVYGSNIGGSIVLARVLPAADFGYYAIVVFVVNFLNIFAGTGFASNLIRMPAEPTLAEKRAVFTSQQVIICLIFAGIWLIAPQLGIWYHLNAHGSLFFRLMGLGLILTSLMVIPQVQMERELAFDKLALIEVCQALVFNIVAIALAVRGFGYISFAIALVLRTGIGALMALFISPWQVGFQMRSEAIWEHLHFGFALQAGQLLAVARDSLTPVFIGMYLGAADVGYVTWAGFVAGISVLIMFPLQRLYLPLFARVQADRKELERFVGRILWAVNGVVAPIASLTVALIHPIVTVIFGAKWLYAVPLVYLFSIGNLMIPSVSVMLSMLNALGKSKWTLYFTLLTVFGTWGMGVPMVLRWGIWGFGYTIAANQLLNLIIFHLVKKEINLNPWPSYWPSWPIALGISAMIVGLCHLHPPGSVMQLIADALIGLLLYGAGMWFTSSRRIRAIIQLLKPAGAPHGNLPISTFPEVL